MSYNSLNTQTSDVAFQNRVVAAATQEAFENPGVHDTAYAVKVRANPSEGIQLVWPVSIATEAEYASALAGGVPQPGQDESVITDNMILAAVQASWIQDAA
jgi:hypothetical protein